MAKHLRDTIARSVSSSQGIITGYNRRNPAARQLNFDDYRYLDSPGFAALGPSPTAIQARRTRNLQNRVAEEPVLCAEERIRAVNFVNACILVEPVAPGPLNEARKAALQALLLDLTNG
jgi:hypothetical protein